MSARPSRSCKSQDVSSALARADRRRRAVLLAARQRIARVGDRAPYALGSDACACLGRRGERDHELLAAPARDEVTLARHVRQHARDALKDRVAGVVTERVVDLLEVVDVEGGARSRERAAFSLAARAFSIRSTNARRFRRPVSVSVDARRRASATSAAMRSGPPSSLAIIAMRRRSSCEARAGSAPGRPGPSPRSRSAPGSRMGGVDHSASTARLSVIKKGVRPRRACGARAAARRRASRGPHARRSP